jgi:hypothetical protein
MSLIHAQFEADCELLELFEQKHFDRFRTADGYCDAELSRLFKGYRIAAQADRVRLKKWEDKQVIVDHAQLKLVDTISFGKGSKDTIKAPQGYTFGIAAVTNKTWPQRFDQQNFVMHYQPVPTASGAEYIDVVLIRHEGTTDKQTANVEKVLKEIDVYFMVKTAKHAEHDGFELRRLTMNHHVFEELQAA